MSSGIVLLRKVLMSMFESLRGLLVQIWDEETSVTWADFEERVQAAWSNGELAGTEYDWLMANKGDA